MGFVIMISMANRGEEFLTKQRSWWFVYLLKALYHDVRVDYS